MPTASSDADLSRMYGRRRDGPSNITGSGSAQTLSRGSVLCACKCMRRIRSPRESSFGLAGPSYTTGAGIGLTMGEEPPQRSPDPAKVLLPRLAAACASILLDSPSRLGASKMSKIGRSRGAPSSRENAIADEPMRLRLPVMVARDVLLATTCCEAVKACRTEEDAEAMKTASAGRKTEGRNGSLAKAGCGAPSP